MKRKTSLGYESISSASGLKEKLGVARAQTIVSGMDKDEAEGPDNIDNFSDVNMEEDLVNLNDDQNNELFQDLLDD